MTVEKAEMDRVLDALAELVAEGADHDHHPGYLDQGDIEQYVADTVTVSLLTRVWDRLKLIDRVNE